MKIFSLCILFSLCFKLGNSQIDSVKKTTDYDTLKYLSGKVYYQGKMLNKEEVSSLLMRYKYAADKYTSSISDKKNASILMVIGAVGAASGIYQVAFKKGSNAFPTFAVAAFSFGCGIPLFHLSKKHFIKAISLYNRSVINRLNLANNPS